MFRRFYRPLRVDHVGNIQTPVGPSVPLTTMAKLTLHFRETGNVSKVRSDNTDWPRKLTGKFIVQLLQRLENITS